MSQALPQSSQRVFTLLRAMNLASGRDAFFAPRRMDRRCQRPFTVTCRSKLARVALSLGLAAMLSVSSAHAQLTESEYLLAGLKIAKAPADLPAQLFVPAEWTAGLRRLGATTLANNREAGACLGIKAQARSEDRNVLMNRYATLVAGKAQMDPATYAAQEKALRDQIEGKGSLENSGINWVVGKIQDGEDMSVQIEVNGLKCEGESVSSAHTHPKPSAAVPSDGDFGYLMHVRQAYSMMVVYEGTNVCAVLKTAQASRENPEHAMAIFIAHQNAVGFEALRHGIGKPGALTDKLYAGVASAAETLGMGLYCGILDGPLKRIKPDAPNVNDEMFVLQAKNLLLSLKLANTQEHREALTYPFTPAIDPAFRRAIAQYGIDETMVSRLTPFALYVTLLEQVLKEQFITGDLFGFFLPDFRSSVPTPITVARSRCYRSDTAKEYKCSLAQTEVRSSVDMTAGRRYSLFDSVDKTSVIVDPAAGLRRGVLLRDTSKQTYQGTCRFNGDVCVPEGKGEVTFKGVMRVQGTFVDGDLIGEAIQTREDSGETWKVNYEADGYREIERLK
ncbi:hypothetical protein [Pandoraea captiosa]|nr:hypothetical protein [Pandoraea captiosa]